MADLCSLKNHRKFLTLKELSGLSDSLILDRMNLFAEQYGRLPELDELPKADSLPHLKKFILMKESKKGTNYATTDKILAATNTSSILEANAIINDIYKDLNTELYDIGNTTFVKVTKRPSEYLILQNNVETKIPESLSQLKIGLQNALEKLRKFYGINISYIDSDEVLENVDVNSAKAFIKNGTIYINLDNATIDSPIHEMLHMFMGSISFSNPSLFSLLISIVEQLPNLEERIQPYVGSRTRSDILEEIFVEELAKYVTGLRSLLDILKKDTRSFILYNIKRDIDTIIDGNYSIKSLENEDIFSKSLAELAEHLESSTFNIKLASGLDDASTHRILANRKSELLKSGELREECE